ncbi:ABC-F type ribosomal protection protein [Fusibacter paucivorans]|uniref:ABC-F type ribosomal protection protein n=1 Tax=Fusibacter paucivorans TaxID=76009 RepID=A0ABS5PJP6_9FIRM|nr:ABC-F type ribosomal protection protein [Fusibacter paucivorans]MBS7525353.1 ABC-F type ribosomal protection protein [Fusibacter paucivorans]
MSQINVKNLTFAYEGTYENIFENVNFQIDTDWKLGFTGRNGRGKTTFLNLLLGKHVYSGRIDTSVNFEYFPYDVRDERVMTMTLLHEVCPTADDWEFMKELSLLEVDLAVLYRAFETLSKGEQTKVLIAAMFLKQNAFMLIDEPTNHLDAAGRLKLGAYLKRKRGYILVSHDRYFLDRCIDHLLSINKTNIDIQKGNFSSWWRNKALQDQYERASNERLKGEIVRLTTAAARTTGWSNAVEQTKYGTRNSGLRPDRGFIGHKSAKMMKRAKSIEARRQNDIESKAKLLKNIETNEPLKLIDVKADIHQFIRIAEVSVAYDDREIFSNISFEVNRGDRIAIIGKNGSGKSSLLKLMKGDKVPHQGLVTMHSQLIISYVSQHTEWLCGSLANYAETIGVAEHLLNAMLNKLGIESKQFEKSLETFSAGQKKKVLIAGSLCQRAHLYIWDEPLNFIDVISRMQIEALLLEEKPTIVFVEHDSAFCETIATKTIAL